MFVLFTVCLIHPMFGQVADDFSLCKAKKKMIIKFHLKGCLLWQVSLSLSLYPVKPFVISHSVIVLFATHI